MNEDAECEKSLTPRDVRSSIFDQTYEGTYEHKKYESNVRLNKAIRNISSTTDQSIKSNQYTLVAKQNKTQSEYIYDGHINHTGKLHERISREKSNPISKGVRRGREPSRLPLKKILTLLNKSKAIERYVRSYIVHSEHIRHRWKRFYRLINIIILKPECADVNQLESLVQKVQRCIFS